MQISDLGMNLEFEKPVSDIEDKITALKAQHSEPSDKVKAQLLKLQQENEALRKKVEELQTKRGGN